MTPFEVMAQGGFGVALMDYGIAANPSGEVIEFSHISMLPDDCIWITDQDDRALKIYSSLRRFKSDMYFQRRLKTIIRDLGLQELNPSELAKVLQTILGWAFDLKGDYIKDLDPKADRFVNFPRVHARHKNVKPVLISAGQRYCALSPVQQSSAPFLLYILPSEFYKTLAQYRYPTGQYRVMTGNAIDPELLQTNHESLSFVKLTNPDAIAQILDAPFWNMSGRISVDKALWLALPEYQYATQWAGNTFEVAEGLAAHQYTSLEEEWPLYELQEPDLRNKRALQERLSYSLFIVFESLIGAHLGHGVKSMTLPEIYLSALARMHQLKHVRKLQENGFPVQGYGGGRIALEEHPMKLSEERRAYFLKLVFDLGLMVTTTDFGIEFQEDSNNPFSTLFALACSGDSHSLNQLNYYVLASK